MVCQVAAERVLPLYVGCAVNQTTMEQLQISKPVASVDIAIGTKARISNVRKVPGKLTHEQDTVLALLEDAHAPDARLSQRDIARSAAWLGCHPKHEADVVSNEFESTTRQVREIIRQLRIEHQIPVLSDRGGYFLPSSQNEADAFIKTLESAAKARAAASMVTYHVMRATLGVTSAFFEAIAAVDAPNVVNGHRGQTAPNLLNHVGETQCVRSGIDSVAEVARLREVERRAAAALEIFNDFGHTNCGCDICQCVQLLKGQP